MTKHETVERGPAGTFSRRGFLQACAGGVSALMVPAAMAHVQQDAERSLSLLNLHTGERLTKVPYWAAGAYVPDALRAFDRLLRDHRTGEVRPIDPRLLDQLHALREQVGRRSPFHVVSGYRSAATNEKLRQRGSGVAKRSLHLQGRAVDVRLPGCELRSLQRAALALRAGGVGYYARSNFIHIDSGRVRSWGRA